VTNAAIAVTPAIPWQTATLTRIVPQTPRITSFFFALAVPFAFVAGQHVDVRLTAADGYRAMRSYSIASAPGDGTTIELAIELLDDGEVSSFFHNIAMEGDSIEMRGPLGGYFLWPDRGHEPVLLAGGGSGVVPLMSMVRHRRAIGETRPCVLLYSARTMDDVLYRDELLELDSQSDGFSLVLTLTRAKATRANDFSRRIDADLVMEALARLPERPGVVYVCGSNAFVNAATDGVLSAGVSERAIRTERYGV
jgi:ferredoxin-NADP reductase